METKDLIQTICTVVGAIGVIVTLMRLAGEVRRNTRAVWASTYQNLTNHITRISFAIASSAELAEFVQRVGLHGAVESEADVLRWEAYAYSVFRDFDNTYCQYVLGALEETRMNQLIDMALVFNLSHYPRMQEYWTRIQGAFAEEFREHVNGILRKINAEQSKKAALAR